MFDDLNQYEVTMHFNGQSTVTMDGDRAAGDSYTIAHHVFTKDGTRQMMVAWLHYLDVFTKIDDAWYIAERQIILQFSETAGSRCARFGEIAEERCAVRHLPRSSLVGAGLVHSELCTREFPWGGRDRGPRDSVDERVDAERRS